MNFPSASSDIITIHGDQQLAYECCIASLWPKESVLTTNNIDRNPGAGLTLTREELDPRTGCNSRIELVEETKTLELSLGKALKLGAGLSYSYQDLVEETLKDNKICSPYPQHTCQVLTPK